MKLLSAEILKQLEQGVSLEEISRLQMPPAEREMLKRCATVRSFDKRLFNEVLRDGIESDDPEALTFERIAAHRIVEHIPRTKGLYQVKEEVRQDYFKAWWESDGRAPATPREEIPRALRALSERLVTYYEDMRGEGDLDRLYHLIAVDRTAARNLLNKLYRDADAEFNRARCRDILNLLEARRAILDAELSERRDYYALYFKARSFWVNEYYQSDQYFERKYLRNHFELFLRDSSRWMMHLHASGGMGKTMFIRWLIARRCVPEPARFPCALIDFDNSQHDPVRYAHEPWLLVLALMTQLNEQIEKHPFYEFITELQERERHLTRDQHNQRKLREDLERFADILLDSKLDRPVFIIFDTLEEAVSRRSAGVRMLIDQMAVLHAKYPPLRLILSGRDHLAQKLPSFGKRFHKEMVDVTLRALSDDESRGYLKRRLKGHSGTVRGERVEAILKKSLGDPFKLAFFSDLLVEPDHKVTPSQIMETDDPALAFLLKKVVDRIEDKHVRWLLRYGAVMRELNPPIIKKVLAPYLRHAGAGRTDLDDPNADLPAWLQDESRYRLSRDASQPDGGFDLGRAWESLYRHAGEYPWILPGDRPGTLRFHPDVADPLRRALKGTAVLAHLHRDAIRYYEWMAAKEPRDWCRWTREAIYHNFQLRGAEAGDYWREKMANERLADDPASRLELSRELTGGDYLRARGQPLTSFSGVKMIDEVTLAQAYFESARAVAEIAEATRQLNTQSDLWREMCADFESADLILRKLPEPVVAPAQLALMRCKIYAGQGKYADALQLVNDALAAGANPRDMFALKVEQADLLARLEARDEAAKSYEEALTTISEMPKAASGLMIRVLQKSAFNYLHIDDFVNAERVLVDALERVGSQGDNRVALELRRNLADLYLRMGDCARALDYAEVGAAGANWARRAEENPHEFIELFRLQMTRGRIFLSLKDPLEALRECTVALEMESVLDSEAAREALAVSTLTQFRAATRELFGTVLGELMEYYRALGELDTARLLYMKAGDSEGAFRCLLWMIEIQLRRIGNSKETAVLLDYADGLIGQNNDETWLRLQLLRAEWLYRAQRNDEELSKERAQKIVKQLIARSQEERWTPRRVVIIALEALAQHGQQSLENYLAVLVDALEKLRPPTARINFQRLLRLCPSLNDVPDSLKATIEQLLPTPQRGSVDYPSLLMNLAETKRILDEKEHAQELFLESMLEFAKVGNWFPLLQTLHSLNRMTSVTVPLEVFKEPVDAFLAAYENQHILCAALHVEMAQHYFNREDYRASADALEAAATQLSSQSVPFLTKWDARIEMLRFEIARRRGDVKAETHYGRRARQHLLVLLGDTSFAQEILEEKNVRVADEQPGESGDDEEERARERIHEGAVREILSARQGAFITTLREGTNQEIIFSSPGVAERYVENHELLAGVVRSPRAEPFSQQALKLFQNDYPKVAEILGKLIPDEISVCAGNYTDRAHHLDLRLEIQGEHLTALPWEFLTLSAHGNSPFSVSDSIRFFYRGLPEVERGINDIENRELSDIIWVQRTLKMVMSEMSHQLEDDGNYGPTTREVVKEFQSAHKLQVDGVAGPATKKFLKRALDAREGRHGPLVLLLRTSPERELDMLRGERTAGVDLADLYTRAGMSVTVLENPTVEQLGGVLRNQAPYIIHLCATMKLSPSLGVYLDFASKGVRESIGESPDNSGLFSISALSNQLKLLPSRHELRPILILDILRPSGISETLRQYFIRNAFASEVFRLGLSPSIVGMGLGGSLEQAEVYPILVEGLAEWRGLGNIVKDMRRRTAAELLRGAEGRQQTSINNSSRLARLIPSVGVLLLTQNPFY